MALGLTAVFGSGYAAGQRQPPAANVGQSEQLLRLLDLTTELESVRGRPLRMRKITMQPGGIQARTHAGGLTPGWCSSHRTPRAGSLLSVLKDGDG